METMIKAVLFDYNGTLFADDDINDMAWKAVINELSQGKIDAESFYGEFIGTRNYPFVEKMFEILGLPHDEEKIMYWAKRKETEYYHKICRSLNRNKLIPGAEELLEELKERKIPFTMCTASLDVNVDFYFEQLKLGQWFDKEKVVYDDGIMTDKRDMYLEGAKRLNVDIKDCLIFDDSPTSIRNGAKAGCKNIVVIKKENNPDIPEIRQRINDFYEFDRSILDD
ncbi:MAG: HAD family phosphatase [Erysipelotrichaceae bacterium]|nr:HAD family phosphatase [Erysipelotrichaceae bacterium]